MRCNCEHGSCEHMLDAQPCTREAGDVRVDMLGLVCDECARTYGASGEYPRLDTGPIALGAWICRKCGRNVTTAAILDVEAEGGSPCECGGLKFDRDGGRS